MAACTSTASYVDSLPARQVLWSKLLVCIERPSTGVWLNITFFAQLQLKAFASGLKMHVSYCVISKDAASVDI